MMQHMAADLPVVTRERPTAQLLAGPPVTSVLDVVDRLLAVQAQDPRGARLAVRARCIARLRHLDAADGRHCYRVRGPASDLPLLFQKSLRSRGDDASVEGRRMTAQTAEEQQRRLTSLTGVLLAGFIAALNLFGLSSTELQTVIRNESRSPTIIAVLLFLALLAAIASILVPPSEKLRGRYAIAAGLSLASIAAMTIYLIPNILSSTDTTRDVALLFALAMGLVAFLAAATQRQPGRAVILLVGLGVIAAFSVVAMWLAVLRPAGTVHRLWLVLSVV